ncbi:MAG: hypothetical protein ACOC1F_03710 [Myxococcota bacterium]
MNPPSVGRILPVLGALVLATSAHAANPFVELPADFASTPAHAYAAMEAATCLQALDERGIAYEQATGGPLVDAPVLLTAPLHDVTFMHVHPRASGAVLDCRLLLALDDFARVLRDHGISEVGFVAAYRPDRTGKAKPGQRHPAGLAMDIAWFRRDDGAKLVIDTDYDGRVGAKTCGKRAQSPRQDNAHGIELRNLVCAVAKERLFHLFLTPNYGRDHHDHVHVEVRRNVRWFLVQ